MKIELKKEPDYLSVKVLGHAKDSKCCHGISSLLWSLLSWAANSDKAEAEEYDFKSGDSYIKVKGCSKDISDFMEWAFCQYAYNYDDITYRIMQDGQTTENKKT